MVRQVLLPVFVNAGISALKSARRSNFPCPGTLGPERHWYNQSIYVNESGACVEDFWLLQNPGL